jgi:hypothetical protein
VSSSQRFEGLCCLHLWGSGSPRGMKLRMWSLSPCFTPEDEGITGLQYVRNYWLSDTVSYPRRLECSATPQWEQKILESKGSSFTCRLIKIITRCYCVKKEEELLTFVESFVWLPSSCICVVRWKADASATTVCCKPPICLCDQEHRIGTCVVCWAIVSCLNIVSKSCVVWYVCASV